MFQYFAVTTAAHLLRGDTGAGFDDLVALWQSRGRDGRLPAWADFSLADFEGWHSGMAMSEVLPGKYDVRFRFFGSDLVAMQGCDLTGQILSERLPEAYDNLYRTHFEVILTEPKIAVGRLLAASDTEKDLMVLLLHLPLSDDGVTIDRVLHFARRLPRVP